MPHGAPNSAASLLRAVGLRPDGPVLWGRPLTTRAPGLYLVELAEPVPAPRLDISRVGKWIERVPQLHVDGARPTAKALAGRLSALWLPSAVVLYAGSTSGSLGGRVLALAHHVIGDRRPHADGHWLHLLTGIDRARLWFAETDAPQEYLDGLLDAFAASVPAPLPPGRPAGALTIPWANLRRPTGERQASGISGSILPDDAPAPVPTRVVELAPGDADGAGQGERGSGTTRRGPSRGTATTRAGAPPARSGAERTPRAPRTPAARVVPVSAREAPVPLSIEALARVNAELDELTRVRRPDVVARIKAARELGDLKENAEYQAAREEQSFLEGRIRLLEERRRNAVLIEESTGSKAVIGSTVVLEHDGERVVYTLVGSTESDPAAGRISVASPVGAALLGAVAGASVEVRTPRGAAAYRVVEVR